MRERDKDIGRIEEMASRLLDPDWPGLSPAEIDELIDLLKWPEDRARTVPGNKEVVGRRSPRSTLFSRRPSIAFSLDDTIQMLPYCWDWQKRPNGEEIEFAIFNPDGVVMACETARCSTRPHGMRVSDAQALAGTILKALAKDVRP